MKKFGTMIFTFCGLLMLAAFPVFGQNDNEPPKEVEINKKPLEDLGKAVVEKVEKDKATTVSVIQINEKPINDLAQYVLAKIENDKVDLSQPFKVVLEGTLVKEARNDGDIVVLDSKKSKWIALPNKEADDPQVEKIAKSAIEAVSDSGFLGYLYNFGIKDLKITFYQTADKVAVNLESKQETAQRAKSLANGFSGLFQMAKMTIKGEDEKFLMSGFQNSSANDKTLLINFKLPKNTVQEMINQVLDRHRIQQAVKGINFNEVKLEDGKDLFGSSVISLVDGLNNLSQKGKFDWNLKGNYEIEGLGFSERDNLPAYMGFGSINSQTDDLFSEKAEEITRNILIKISNLGLGDFYSQFIDYKFTVENGELHIKAKINNKNEKDARILADELKKNVDSFSNKNREKFVAERTEITSNNEQVFITIKLPRTSLDAIIKSGG